MNNIKFPTSQEEFRNIKEGFYRIAEFPNVIGAIDGTLIPILAPGEDEEAYVCRKNFHAINVQAICESNLRFTNVVCRWPGATHDAFVLSQSKIPEHLEGTLEGWLLGDSGYPLKKWLMTPLANPVLEKEIKYNQAHIKTRNTIERAFGVLKSRFR
ncbi:hypothetical protein FSP39_015880 [Pinctada imbricata]|uniref:DDE Tnp4 domain-containing protein n=1 Tax=Pinctada imbricata TaxID=66713 RepID=A0AA88YL69_PINIB|nr:hypothetical protein FSP39_015002 [Pinctada imbricata]KAK3107499.1 hypothetical protein FSP39_015880 [Pinctada imbricata]